MGKRITKAADLPDWFEPRKYEATLHLDPAGWVEQLELRKFCYELFWQQQGDALGSTVDYLGFELRELLADMRATPIYQFYASEYHAKIVERSGASPSPSALPGIRALTPGDIIRFVAQLTPDRRRDLLEILSRSIEELAFIRREDQAWLEETLEEFPEQVLVVNTFLPNKLLIESFERFLTASEKNSPLKVRRQPRANIFLEWCNCGLLPYLDLRIWGMETDTEISNKALASGIFPKNPEKGEENIRKTTQKHAEDIVDGALPIWALRAFAENTR